MSNTIISLIEPADRVIPSCHSSFYRWNNQ